EILVDRVRLEQRDRIVDAQHRHLLVRRDGEEPVGPVVRLDVAEFERDVLLAQRDRGALHPRTRLEADQQIFGHRAIPGGPRASVKTVTSDARGRGASMTDQAAAPAIIRNYHVHVYYDPAATRATAERLRERVAAAFPQAVLGRWHDALVGPHTQS